jgi:hypothetical protein
MAFPDITIPGIPPTGNCCTWRLEKKAEGELTAKWGDTYACETGKTRRGDIGMKLKVGSGGAPCDQNPTVVPDGCVLEARGYAIQRVTDPFAHFFGTFLITDPAGTALFRGALELFNHMGTHHDPWGTEKCDEEGHAEGWLVGRGATTLSSITARGLIVARTTFPLENGSTPIFATIDGALIRC